MAELLVITLVILFALTLVILIRGKEGGLLCIQIYIGTNVSIAVGCHSGCRLAMTLLGHHYHHHYFLVYAIPDAICTIPDLL